MAATDSTLKAKLLEAVKNNDCERINALLKQGADLTWEYDHRDTLLHIAVENGNSDAAELLLAKDINVHAKNIEGNTALHLAAINDYNDLLPVLLEYGADIHAKNNCDETPLHKAAMHNSIDFGDRLLKEGAAVDARSYDGRTPLHYAAFFNHKNFVTLLLIWGAKINPKERDGETPLYTAIRHKHNEIVDLLFANELKLKRKVLIGEDVSHDPNSIPMGEPVTDEELLDTDHPAAPLVPNYTLPEGGIVFPGDNDVASAITDEYREKFAYMFDLGPSDGCEGNNEVLLEDYLERTRLSSMYLDSGDDYVDGDTGEDPGLDAVMRRIQREAALISSQDTDAEDDNPCTDSVVSTGSEDTDSEEDVPGPSTRGQAIPGRRSDSPMPFTEADEDKQDYLERLAGLKKIEASKNSSDSILNTTITDEKTRRLLAKNIFKPIGGFETSSGEKALFYKLYVDLQKDLFKLFKRGGTQLESEVAFLQIKATLENFKKNHERTLTPPQSEGSYSLVRNIRTYFFIAERLQTEGNNLLDRLIDFTTSCLPQFYRYNMPLPENGAFRGVRPRGQGKP